MRDVSQAWTSGARHAKQSFPGGELFRWVGYFSSVCSGIIFYSFYSITTCPKEAALGTANGGSHACTAALCCTNMKWMHFLNKNASFFGPAMKAEKWGELTSERKGWGKLKKKTNGALSHLKKWGKKTAFGGVIVVSLREVRLQGGREGKNSNLQHMPAAPCRGCVNATSQLFLNCCEEETSFAFFFFWCVCVRQFRAFEFFG